MSYPQAFGRYTLEERIGLGGMAEVFRARTNTQGFAKPLCIKRIAPYHLHDPEFERMFRNEAALAAQLTHGNIVQVFDFGEAEGSLYLAMELVEGADLKTLLERARERGAHMPVGCAVQVAVEMCRGLHYAHTRTQGGQALDIVHRDISPHNVLLSQAGEVKVADFGIAKAVARASHTATGTIKGKLAYMAPEQARGQGVDHRVDQFATGIVLWEMLTGTRLFHAEDEATLLGKVLRADVPPPSRLRPEVPEALEEVLLRALAPDVRARFDDMEALARALTRFLHSAFDDPAAFDVRAWVAPLLAAGGARRQTAQLQASGDTGNAVDVQADTAPEGPGVGGRPHTRSTAPMRARPSVEAESSSLRERARATGDPGDEALAAPLLAAGQATHTFWQGEVDDTKSTASSPPAPAEPLPAPHPAPQGEVAPEVEAPSAPPSPAERAAAPTLPAPSDRGWLRATSLGALSLLAGAGGTYAALRASAPPPAAEAMEGTKSPAPGEAALGDAALADARSDGPPTPAAAPPGDGPPDDPVAPGVPEVPGILEVAVPIELGSNDSDAANPTPLPAAATPRVRAPRRGSPPPQVAPGVSPGIAAAPGGPASPGAAGHRSSVGAGARREGTTRASGMLWVDVERGWARAWLGKRFLGETPCTAEVPEGEHTLTLLDDAGRRQQHQVRIRKDAWVRFVAPAPP